MINFNKKYLVISVASVTFLLFIGLLISFGQKNFSNKSNSANVYGVGERAAKTFFDYDSVDGECGEPENVCEKGAVGEVLDTEANYNWSCSGSRGGRTAFCSYPKKGAKCGKSKGSCERGQASRPSSSIDSNSCPIWAWRCSTENPDTIQFCEANRIQWFPFIYGCW
jgi:hypothetical protein